MSLPRWPRRDGRGGMAEWEDGWVGVLVTLSNMMG